VVAAIFAAGIGSESVTIRAAAQEPAAAAPQRGDRAWLLPLPEAQADPAIPTLKQVVGHEWAEDISSHGQIDQYLHALADAAPDRARLFPIGRTFEGRPLSYLVISSPENIGRLEEIRKDNLRLADPRRLPEADARALAAVAPAIVWLAYGVHGNEISSGDAALLTAYTLLADTRAENRDLLEKVVVILDPAQNPDGRDRFIASSRQARGVFPSGEPFASERTEPWPGGRYNHYLFDMNRDWYIQTQAETRARVAAYLRWQPQVFVDAHEMGGESNYYFDPPADPINSQITPLQRDWFQRFGRAQGARFDRYGFPYTSRETYDGYYPGYGSTWPTMHGALGILWEQASARGLFLDRRDETTLHYHDGVRHHYVSGLVTIETAAAQKDDLLMAFYRTRATAVSEGAADSAYDYFLLPGETPARVARLAQLLVANGLEVYRLAAAGRVSAAGPDGQKQAREVPAGAYVVPSAQPAGRLARTLLEPADDMGKAFIDRQIDRKARRLGDEIYDVTAWSLPMTFGVECDRGRATGGPRGEAVAADAPAPGGSVAGPDEPAVGYLVPAQDEAALAGLSRWLQRGYRAHVADQPFVLSGTSFPRGTILLRTAENPDSIHQEIRRDAEELGLAITGIDTSYVDSGAGLGGGNISWVRPPRVLLAVGESLTPFVGHTWYLFDQEWKYPTTRVLTRNLSAALDPAEDYNVLVLPSGSYGLGAETVDRIRDWVRAGGTLVTIGGATEWATGEEVGLLATKPRKKKVGPIPGEGLDEAAGAEDAGEDEEEPARFSDKGELAEDEDEGSVELGPDAPEEDPDPVPGAFLKATLYDDHWVTFGLPRSADLLVNAGLILEPMKPTEGRNLVTYPEQEKPVSGFVWPATMELIGKSSAVVYQSSGRGHVIGFADDPNFRGFSPVTQRLFQNAVFFSPGH
jgi:hypothetical protein